jgi:protein O-mannosyl-transferase
MNLTQDQKYFLKRNYKSMTTLELAEKTNLQEKEIKHYLGKKFGFHSSQSSPTKKFSSDLHDINLFQLIKKSWIPLCILTLIVIATYINGINNSFVSDDIDGILKNKTMGDFSYVFSNVRNVVNSLIYFILFKIGGYNPVVFRTYNILLHIGTVCLIFLIIQILTQKKYLSFFAASLFAVHPLLTEAVTWISGRPYTQYGFFLLLSFLFYLLSVKKKFYYFLSLILFIFAVSTSEKAIAFPLIIFLFEFSQGHLRKNYKKLLGFLILLLIGGGYFATQIGQRIKSVTELSAGSSGQMQNPIFTIPVAIGTYFEMFVWPSALTIYHSEMTFTVWQFVTKCAILILYSAGTIYSYFKNRLLFFFLTMFIVSLLPTLTPFGISWIVAERYVYFGSVGVFFGAAFFINYLLEKTNQKEIILPLFAMLLLIFSIRTMMRNSEWKNEDSLWISTAKNSPSSQSTHNNMGDVYARRKDYQNAILEFKKSIEINPKYADAWHNLALSYQSIGQKEEAIKTYQKAIELNPKLWQSMENLTLLYFDQNRLDEAEAMIQKLIELKPDNPEYYHNLGIVRYRKGDVKSAKELLQKTLIMDPNNKGAKDLLKQIK